jgi:hypothetical protein
MEFSSDDERSAGRLIGSFGTDDRAEVDATLTESCKIVVSKHVPECGYIMI